MLTVDGFNAGVHEHEHASSQSQNRLASKLNWQLVLEKAYLDSESEHVSPGEKDSLPKIESQASYGGKTETMRERGLPIRQEYATSESMLRGFKVCVTTDKVLQPTPVGTVTRPKNAGQQLGVVSVGTTYLVQGSARERAPQITTPAQPSTAFGHSAEGDFMRLVEMGDGMQLIIRSTELDGEAALRLSKEVQRVLAAKERPLIRVLLNGQSLWDTGGTQHGEHSDSEFTEYRINKTY